ncbi:NAD/NADP-dependent betaine aldehyde dehydrogenase [Cupriavidus sp. TA19]|uniref:aldehyde dehydrogenase family protein n=1 Tax=unclassified Cupriavidus TaxID=2640874 RepID=UPI000E2F50B0|nr:MULTISPECIES: aldehyde dehydrogenase family protein [unclassified Cupriavidus]BDB30636.1 aldehyde dehydrogenase [Cupriavidus sp. P-10]GLC95724.1 NAD/NADP-dependent betaine aldehyde dehydrogenase [Cupriavidus sp. TA19]
MSTTFDVISPVSGETVNTLTAASDQEINDAVQLAIRAQKVWAAMTPEVRSERLWAWGALIEKHYEEIARLDTSCTGKVLRDARVDARRGARHARYWAGMTDKIYGQQLADITGRLSYTKREPLGAYLVILPWNAPAHSFMARATPPLACGNSVIVKPSELSPLSASRLVSLSLEAGIPEGVLQVVHGTGEVGGALSAHPGIRGISFTGSPGTGRRILHAAADTFKKVTLELGGKSPIVVFPDADLDSAARAVVMGIAANAGQICAASSRLIVHREIASHFVSELRERFSRIVVGDPNDESTQVGPIVCRRQFDHVMGLIDRGVRQGATLVTGGGKPQHLRDDRGLYVAPTLLDLGDRDLDVGRAEVFGPVLTVSRFDTEEDATTLANETEYGLAAYVWTSDAGRLVRMMDAIDAGVVHGNSTLVMDSGLPFGGFKSSGLGGAFGIDAIEGCTQTKRYTIRTGVGQLPQLWDGV